MERKGWTEAELEAMTESDRYDLFMHFADGPEIAFRARNTIEGLPPHR